MKSNAISFRFSEETIYLIKKLAELEQRSITNTIEVLVHKEAKKQKIKYQPKEDDNQGKKEE